jgi:hypothetical protein
MSRPGPSFYCLYINDSPEIPVIVYLVFFSDDTHLCDRSQRHVLRKLLHGLSFMEPWFECCNIKINKHNTRVFISVVDKDRSRYMKH